MGAKHSRRILFVSMEYPPETGFGGIGSYVACVARMLARRGHEVHVLSCAPGQVPLDNLDGEVLIHRRGGIHVRGLARLTRSWHAAARLEAAFSCWREAIRLDANFDIVEIPDWMGEGLFIAASRRWPLVGHLHGPLHIIMQANHMPLDYAAWFGDRLERAAMRRADLITCLASHMATDLVEADWIRGSPVRILPFPIDMDRWLEVSPVRATRPTILVVGRIEPHKAQALMVKAA